LFYKRVKIPKSTRQGLVAVAPPRRLPLIKKGYYGYFNFEINLVVEKSKHIVLSNTSRHRKKAQTKKSEISFLKKKTERYLTGVAYYLTKGVPAGRLWYTTFSRTSHTYGTYKN
jgi:hypothetical protein